MSEQTYITLSLSGQPTAPSFEGRIILACLLALSMLSIGFILHTPNASAATKINPAYSCGPNPHCYGGIYWPNSVNGATTSISVRGMGGGDFFVTHELWLIDTNSNSQETCIPGPGQPNGYCWVEGGYKAYGSFYGPPYAGTERWFWADERPGSYYRETPGPPLAAGDFGHYVYDELFKSGIDPTQPWCPSVQNEWCININGQATVYLGMSTNNTMHVDSIEMGQEVSGLSGAWANPAEFTHNQWIGGNFHYQTNAGSPLGPNGPISAYWVSQPYSGYGNSGGDFRACLLNSGC